MREGQARRKRTEARAAAAPLDFTRLLIAVPTMGSVHSRLAALMIEWAQDFPRERIGFFLTQRVYPHDRARNQIAAHFLHRTRASHLLMIDSDMLPPADAPQKLLAHGLPFVTGMTPIAKHDPKSGTTAIIDFCFGLPQGPEGTTPLVRRNTGLQEIDRCAAGCLMLHRSVFDALTPPYFRFTFSADGVDILESEDVDFCHRLRAAGVRLHADTSVICRHDKTVLL